MVPATPIREMFNRICGRYDLLNLVLSFGLDRYWRSRAVSVLKLSEGDRVVDLCCGTGDLSQALWKRTGQVVGVDFAEQMLDIARVKFPAIEFVWGDVCEVPLEATFDAATIAFGPRNIADLQKLWHEMSRLVRPGGQVLSLELTRPKGWLSYLHRFYLNVIVPVIGNLISGDARAYAYLSRTIKGFMEASELKASMEQAGLRDVRVIPLNGGIATLHVGRVP
jgi:demethylmenaquinone methyltransferase/2-methoxy-6-polyprenyl-1,4-benzoquinol methylase